MFYFQGNFYELNKLQLSKIT